MLGLFFHAPESGPHAGRCCRTGGSLQESRRATGVDADSSGTPRGISGAGTPRGISGAGTPRGRSAPGARRGGSGPGGPGLPTPGRQPLSSGSVVAGPVPMLAQQGRPGNQVSFKFRRARSCTKYLLCLVDCRQDCFRFLLVCCFCSYPNCSSGRLLVRWISYRILQDTFRCSFNWGVERCCCSAAAAAACDDIVIIVHGACPEWFTTPLACVVAVHPNRSNFMLCAMFPDGLTDSCCTFN